MSTDPLVDLDEPKVLSLAKETQFAERGIVSRTILQTPGTRVVLFGFAAGQELTEHTSTSNALVEILSGECDFSVKGKVHHLKAGDFLYMPRDAAHAVKATQQFSMLLTLIKPMQNTVAERPKRTTVSRFAVS